MDSKSFYLSLPHDLSGSMSKNRFRLELLWGVSKTLDLMEEPIEFTTVFDYACDIEVHLENSFNFFQIKTRKNNKSYTTASLTKKNGEASILGRLYSLKSKNDEGKVKLALVSNVPYSSMSDDSSINSFFTLPKKEKEKIEDALKSELGLNSIDLNDMLYIHTGMNLESPENEVRGKLVVTFEKIKGCEPTNPNALYRLILDTVQEKACYEYSCSDYEEVIKNKGITRRQFEDILDSHSEAAKTGVQKTRDYIDNIQSVSHRRIYKRALAKMLPIMSTSKLLKQLEKEVASLLLNSNELGTEEDILDILTKKFHDHFPTEIENSEKIVFYLIIIFRFEEGGYDDESYI